jgi:hypothetical protein
MAAWLALTAAEDRVRRPNLNQIKKMTFETMQKVIRPLKLPDF